MFYQSAITAVALIPFSLVPLVESTAFEVGLLLLVGIIFTAMGHTLFVKSLEHISASTAGIISGIQPFYGVFAAAWSSPARPSRSS